MNLNALFFVGSGQYIVEVMLVGAITTPLVDLLLSFAVKWSARQLDRGCCIRNSQGKLTFFETDQRKTKLKGINQYVELYSGPTLDLTRKYSRLLTITFVTLMYGFGMPVLYPIALLSVLILYAVEKCMLYYGYRQPPMYDDQLYTMVCRVLKFAPLLFCLFSYWMYTDIYLLSEDAPAAKEKRFDQPSIQKHKSILLDLFIKEAWTQYSWPFLLLFIVALVILLFGTYLLWLQDKVLSVAGLGPSSTFQMVVDQKKLAKTNKQAPNFWLTLKKADVQWIEYEQMMGKELQCADISSQSWTRFKTLYSPMNDLLHELLGACSYSILANPDYQKQFAYAPCSGEYWKEFLYASGEAD